MTYDPVGPLHEGRADGMPAGPADVASQIRAVAARICPAIRMGSAELRDAHTIRIPAADGILREELLRHRPFRLGRPRLLHPLVGLVLWMIWKNDRPGDAGVAGKGALGSAIVNVVLFILWIVFADVLSATSGSC